MANSQYTEFLVLVLKIIDFVLKPNYFEKQPFSGTVVVFTEKDSS